MNEHFYRHEIKYVISAMTRFKLINCLGHVFEMDEHSRGKPYTVKTLYFDSVDDNALRRKIEGSAYREKYRLRSYNNDTEHIKLEMKVRESSAGYKLSTFITKNEAESLMTKVQENNALVLIDDAFKTVTVKNDFLIKKRLSFLDPKVVMEYEREAFICRMGNTRITVDSRVRTCLCGNDFRGGFLGNTYPYICNDPLRYILEVKYDDFLPDIVRDLIRIPEANQTANSKYLTGRSLCML